MGGTCAFVILWGEFDVRNADSVLRAIFDQGFQDDLTKLDATGFHDIIS